jgi:peroxiredoxin (alkyl hydroperoxide reductase subunit C)
MDSSFQPSSDFTPVCTSEFMTFAKMEDDFKNLNTQLVGLSVDGLYSHIAWLRTIKEKIEFRGWKNVEVKFLLLKTLLWMWQKIWNDPTGKAPQKQYVPYSLLIRQQRSEPSFIIPYHWEENFEELKRVLIGLQTADKFSIATRQTGNQVKM